MAKAKPEAIKVIAAQREPNARDKAAIAFASGRVLARRKRAAANVIGESNDLQLHPPHSDADGFQKQLLDTFGTSSQDFLNVTLVQVT